MYFSPSMNVVACKTDGLSMPQYFFFNCIMSENGYIWGLEYVEIFLEFNKFIDF